MKLKILCFAFLAALLVTPVYSLDFSESSGVTEEELQIGLRGELAHYAGEFVAAEERTGMDAALFAAIAAAESGWGTSDISYEKNNLFGWTTKDGSYMYFDSYAESIQHCTNSIAKNYLTPGGAYYAGTTLEAVSKRYCPGDSVAWATLVTDTHHTIMRRIEAGKGVGNMYICKDCGKAFHEPLAWYDTHGFDMPPFERHFSSPCCYADYDDAVECDLCHGTYAADQIRNKLCGKCRDETVKQFRYFLHNEFTKAQRQYINDVYDGEELS